MLYDPNWTLPATEIKLEPWQNLLLDAAKIIEERGWTTHTLQNIDGSVCARGALQIAQCGGALWEKDSRRWRYSFHDNFLAQVALCRAIGDLDITSWNDCSNTKTNVIQTMRRAALTSP